MKKLIFLFSLFLFLVPTQTNANYLVYTGSTFSVYSSGSLLPTSFDPVWFKPWYYPCRFRYSHDTYLDKHYIIYTYSSSDYGSCNGSTPTPWTIVIYDMDLDSYNDTWLWQYSYQIMWWHVYNNKLYYISWNATYSRYWIYSKDLTSWTVASVYYHPTAWTHVLWLWWEPLNNRLVFDTWTATNNPSGARYCNLSAWWVSGCTGSNINSVRTFYPPTLLATTATWRYSPEHTPAVSQYSTWYVSFFGSSWNYYADMSSATYASSLTVPTSNSDWTAFNSAWYTYISNGPTGWIPSNLTCKNIWLPTSTLVNKAYSWTTDFITNDTGFTGSTYSFSYRPKALYWEETTFFANDFDKSVVITTISQKVKFFTSSTNSGVAFKNWGFKNPFSSATFIINFACQVFLSAYSTKPVNLCNSFLINII